MAHIFIHPKGFFNLVGNEVFDRLSFYGLVSMLVIVAVQHFNFSDQQAYQLYGAFTTLAFLVPILGGFVTDKCFSHSKSIFLGLALAVIGNVGIGLSGYHSVFIGLAFLICGIALLKANNASLLGLLYDSDDKRKEGGFTLLYMGMNLGAILGPILYGFISIWFGWRYGFFLSAIGLGGMAVFYYFKLQVFSEIEKKRLGEEKTHNLLYVALGIVIVILVAYFLLSHLNIFPYAVAVIGLFVISILINVVMKQNKLEFKRMLFLLVLDIFAVFYFACQNQVSSSLMMFISHYSSLGYLPHKIPVQIFASLEPLFVILSAPLFAKVWQYCLGKMSPSELIMFRVGLSLVAAVISFLLFKLAAIYGVHSVAFFLCGIILGNLFLGFGELFIGPALLSGVTFLISKKYQATFMGVWSLAIAFSGFFGGVIAQLTAVHSALSSNSMLVFSQAFGEIALITAVVAVVFGVISPFLRRLAVEKGNG